MFDTVLFRHTCNEPRLDRFTSIGNKFVFNPARINGRALPNLTWRTAPNGVGYLDASVSLPKMLFGNNIQMISELDIPRALDAISTFVSDATGVEFNAWTALIGRLDICQNWQVGEAETYAYLHALRLATHKHLKRRVHEDGDVEWLNQSQKVIAYAKHNQMAKLARKGEASDMDVMKAIGVFRLENQFKGSGRCRRLAKDHLKLPDRCAEYLLCAEVAETIMDETIMELGLDNYIESGESRRALLFERYKLTSKYFRLCGFLDTCDEKGADNLVNLGMNPDTFDRYVKEVKAAGAWLTTPTRATLPPLRLVTANRAEATVSVGNE